MWLDLANWRWEVKYVTFSAKSQLGFCHALFPLPWCNHGSFSISLSPKERRLGSEPQLTHSGHGTCICGKKVLSCWDLDPFWPQCSLVCLFMWLSQTLFFFLLFLKIFIYLFMAVLGLRFCARAFSSWGRRGPLFIAVRGPLTIAASLVAGHRL